MVDWIQSTVPSVDLAPLLTLANNGRHNSTLHHRLNIFDSEDIKTALTIAVSNAINCYPTRFDDPDHRECIPAAYADDEEEEVRHRRNFHPGRRRRKGRHLEARARQHQWQSIEDNERVPEERQGRKLNFKFWENWLGGAEGDSQNEVTRPQSQSTDTPSKGQESVAEEEEEEYEEGNEEEDEYEDGSQEDYQVTNTKQPFPKSNQGSPTEAQRQTRPSPGAEVGSNNRRKFNWNRADGVKGNVMDGKVPPTQPKHGSKAKTTGEDSAEDRFGYSGALSPYAGASPLGGYGMPTQTYDLGGYWGVRQPKGGCYCAIGGPSGGKGKKHKKKKKKDINFAAFYLMGYPLAIFGTLALGTIGLGVGFLIGVAIRRLTSGREFGGQFGDFLLRGKRDLANELEFIDENEIVLRMLDDLMMTYKYGYIPKCSDYHICKLNKAAAFGGSPQSTVIPLVSLPAAFILGKPTSKVMDYLHAVWLGRNERDCDEAFPECSDAHVSQSDASLKGGSFSSSSTTSAKPPLLSRFGNSTSTVGDEIGGDVDAILKDLRFLEENASKSTSPPTPTPTPGSSSTAASGTTPFNSM